jgi:hypothetical protein
MEAMKSVETLETINEIIKTDIPQVSRIHENLLTQTAGLLRLPRNAGEFLD